jgi:hypothetical protein
LDFRVKSERRLEKIGEKGEEFERKREKVNLILKKIMTWLSSQRSELYSVMDDKPSEYDVVNSIQKVKNRDR